MKLLLFILFISTYSIAQDNFKWDIVDSIPKSKDQIYRDTKLYVANKWVSAKDIIQIDDKDNGEILIKVNQIKEMRTFFDFYTYEFRYTIDFKMKDNKFKISIYDAQCINAKSKDGSDIYKITPGNKANYTTPMGVPSDEKIVKMMNELQNDINLVYQDYINNIKKTSTTKTDW